MTEINEPTADRRAQLRAALKTAPATAPQVEPQRRVPRYTDGAPAVPASRFTRASAPAPAATTDSPPDIAAHAVPALPPTGSYVYIEDEEAVDFVGSRVKLDASSGRYALPRDGTWLAEGRTFVVTGTSRAWVRFENNRRAETIPYSSNYPKRRDLEPPAPEDKSKLDPWADTAYLMLVDYESDEEYTFYTSANHARGAVNRLSHQIIEKQRTAPGARAMIQLRSSKREEAGRRPYFIPIFELCGWELPSGEVV
jgi:hypothetical protein